MKFTTIIAILYTLILCSSNIIAVNEKAKLSRKVFKRGRGAQTKTQILNECGEDVHSRINRIKIVPFIQGFLAKAFATITVDIASSILSRVKTVGTAGPQCIAGLYSRFAEIVRQKRSMVAERMATAHADMDRKTKELGITEDEAIEIERNKESPKDL